MPEDAFIPLLIFFDAYGMNRALLIIVVSDYSECEVCALTGTQTKWILICTHASQSSQSQGFNEPVVCCNSGRLGQAIIFTLGYLPLGCLADGVCPGCKINNERRQNHDAECKQRKAVSFYHFGSPQPVKVELCLYISVCKCPTYIIYSAGLVMQITKASAGAVLIQLLSIVAIIQSSLHPEQKTSYSSG
ncbi:MAG: hypothetical protein AAFR90_06745 [Pseudomonadota bacterium]